MDKGETLFGGLISISLGLFVLYYTYKYFKKGKMREISIFSRKVYSFKKQPKEAYRTLTVNCIAALCGLIGGTILLLVYFDVLK